MKRRGNICPQPKKYGIFYVEPYIHRALKGHVRDEKAADPEFDRNMKEIVETGVIEYLYFIDPEKYSYLAKPR